ncbi:MAG: nitroreductase family protein [Thermodesulfobacteriota bacterium]
MDRVKAIALVLLAVCLCPPSALFPAEEAQVRTLPDPRWDGGRTLMQALKDRRSTREFAPQSLPDQVLSELLWAAYGVNRSDTGDRTAPSAHNRQEIDVYVTLRSGLYRYETATHSLRLVKAEDLPGLTGRQKFPATAPMNLVYVADFLRTLGVPPEAAIQAASVSAGAIVQNVYLYCASEGLGAVVRGWIDRPVLAKAMGLREDQYMVIAQTVGYPAGQ